MLPNQRKGDETAADHTVDCSPEPAIAPEWLASSAELATWMPGDGARIALDTEFIRERTFWPKLALIQVAQQRDVRLLDPTTFERIEVLGETLVAPGRTVLIHSASEDLVAIRPLLPSPLIGLYDTQIAAAFAGLGAGVGYQGLVNRLVGVELEKQETRSDWLARPLSERQLRYAMDDVLHLEELHDQLDARLRERGFNGWHREECQRLARDSWLYEPDQQPQLGFRHLARWPTPAQAQLRRILLWREHAARERDLPRRWVVDDDTAVAIAVEPTHSAARLAQRLADGPSGRRRSLQALLALVDAPISDADLAATAAIDAPADPALKPVIKRLKQAVETEASRLDLPPSLLCTRRAIEKLATTGQWPAELNGWRAALLQQPLSALI